MNKKIYLFLFAGSLAADIIGILLSNETVQVCTKPLIVLALLGYFITKTSVVKSVLKKWIVGALVFSWIGDVLLMFHDEKGNFFLLGLSAFLIAHIFYIIFFHRLRVIEAIKARISTMVIVVIYYTALIWLLSPGLGEMKLPVRIYGVVISFMLLLAMHMLFLRDKTAGRWMMAGAVLFVISDSILAINKFYHSFDAAGPLIMLTYGVAQLFIVLGATKRVLIEN